MSDAIKILSFEERKELIYHYLTRYRYQTILVFLGLLVSSISEGFGIMTLVVVAQLIIEQEVVSSGKQIMMLFEFLKNIGIPTNLGPVLLMVVVALIAKAVLLMLALSYAEYVGAKIESDYRLNLIQVLMRAKWQFYSSTPVGRFANALNLEASSGAKLYSIMCRAAAVAISIVVYLVSALFLSWTLALTAIAVSVVMLLLLSKFLSVSKTMGYRRASLYRSMVSRLTDGIQGIKSLKSMGQEGYVEPMLKSSITKLQWVQFIERVSKIGLTQSREPIIVLCAALGMYYALQYLRLDIALVIGMTIIFHRALNAVGQLQRVHQSAVSIEGYYASFLDITRQAVSQQEVNLSDEPVTQLNGNIVFRNVGFRYGDVDVLSNVEFSLPIGEISVIVGASGSGKTTLVDLICRLYEPHSGSIELNKTPIKSFDLHHWRKQIGYVQQESILFHASVEQNIGLNDPSIEDEDIKLALVKAGAWDFIEELPKGAETIVGERGTKLSGGQRQRILIARALVRNPSILILDEATAGLDTATESSLAKTITQLQGAMTIISISHHNFIAAYAHRVYRLHNCKVIEELRRTT